MSAAPLLLPVCRILNLRIVRLFLGKPRFCGTKWPRRNRASAAGGARRLLQSWKNIFFIVGELRLADRLLKFSDDDLRQS